MVLILFVHGPPRELSAHVGSLLLLLSFLGSQNPQLPTSASLGHPLLAGGVVTGYTVSKVCALGMLRS